ncbi:MAG: tetratricopeptide repeat protein [bacterium]
MKYLKFACVLVFLLVITPRVVSASYQDIRQLEEKGYHNEARRQYESFVGQNPAHTEALRGLIRSSLATEKWEVARQALEKYDELEPGKPWTALHSSRLYFFQSKYDTALQWAEIYRQRAPERWEPYHAKTQINLARGNYVLARENVNSARQRSNQNPWVMMDSFLVQLNLEGNFNEQLLSETLSRSSNPVIYWRVSRSQHIAEQPARVRDLLAEGFSYFPADEPPFLSPASESEYRYWLSRAYLSGGEISRAREILADTGNNSRKKWLEIILTDDEDDKFQKINNLLNHRPDDLLYRLLHSRLARRREGLNGERRKNSAKFFYDEFQILDGMNYKEAALSALMRSLELNPLNSSHQFELARYFYHRGWENKLSQTLERVRELGFSPPERIEDYEESVRGDTPPEIPENFTSPQVRLFFTLDILSFWEAPPGGEDLLEFTFHQAFHHQPAFELYGPQDFDDNPSPSALMREDVVDGTIDIDVTGWNDRLQAAAVAKFEDDTEQELDFYGSRRIKIWRLQEKIITLLKQNWPWEGKVFAIDNLEIRVNLGAIHGINTDDQFQVRDVTLPVVEVFERQSVLELPTPVYSGYLARGDTARLIRSDNGE